METGADEKDYELMADGIDGIDEFDNTDVIGNILHEDVTKLLACCANI